MTPAVRKPFATASLAPRRRSRRRSAGRAFAAAIALTATMLVPAAAQADDCPNATVRIQQSATDLPECRAYELVSWEHQGFPTGAGLAPIETPNPGVWVDPSGEWVAYPSLDPFVGDSGAPGTYRSTRGPERWTTMNLFPPAPEVVVPKPGSTVAVSEDGRTLLLTTAVPLLPSDTDTISDLYVNDVETGLSLVTVGTPSNAAFYAGRSRDLSHVFFHTVGNLVPEATGTAMKLYEWEDGTIRLVGIKPDGTVNPGGSVLGRREDGTSNTAIPINAVTADAGSVVFTSPAPSKSAGNPTRVYIRQNAVSTIEASASQCTRVDCNAAANVAFAGASRDGSTVFMVTSQQLTDDDTDTTDDLYAFDADSSVLTQLSAGLATAPSGVGASSPVLGSSDDGQRVYFTLGTTKRIVLWDHGVVADIGLTGSSLAAARQNCVQPGSVGIPQVTPDGDVLVFPSVETLTPTDPADPSGPGLYRYEASSGELIKIATSGSLTRGSSTVSLDCHLRRSVTDDGDRVFFTADEPLVAQDVNGTMDVYGWVDGQLALISTGVAAEGSVLHGVGAEDGRDVFFSTISPLVPRDQDDVRDLYDARVGGGSLVEPVPSDCVGDGCRGPLAGAPTLPRAGSTELVGPGDVADVAPRVSARILRGSAGRRLARRGRLAVVVRSSEVVRARVTVRAQVGGRASSSRSLAPGRQRLVLSLSETARARLDRVGRLRVTVVIRYSKTSPAKRLSAVLSRTGR